MGTARRRHSTNSKEGTTRTPVQPAAQTQLEKGTRGKARIETRQRRDKQRQRFKRESKTALPWLMQRNVTPTSENTGIHARRHHNPRGPWLGATGVLVGSRVELTDRAERLW